MKRALLLVFGLGWACLAAAQAFVAGRIEVVGNVHITAREILAAVPFKAGDTVTREQVLAARDAILDLGYFSEVSPELAFEEGDLIVLRFRVVEFPKIGHVAIEGVPPAPKGKGTLWSWIQAALAAPPVTEARVREILADHGIKSGQVLNRKKLEQGLQAVLEEYRNKDIATVQIGNVIPGEELVIEIQELNVVGHRFQGLSMVPEEEARKLVAVPVGALGKMSAIQASLAQLTRSVFFAEANLTAEPAEDGLVLVWQLKERVLLPTPMELKGIALAGVKAFPAEHMQARLAPLPSGAHGIERNRACGR